MPFIPPPTTNLDSLTSILNATKVRLNEEVPSLMAVSGRILENGPYFTLQSVNTAWRKLLEHLVTQGYSALASECIIASFPPVASTDPASQCWISLAGCWDGVSFYATPALPSDFTHPLKVWERQSGKNAEFSSDPMEKVLDGLPTLSKSSRAGCWEWRNEAIYFPGSLVVEDLRIRYARNIPDFADSGTTQWFASTVPLIRCSDPFSLFLCAEFASSRGQDALAQRFEDRAITAACKLTNRDVRADERVDIRRQSAWSQGSEYF